MGQMMKASFRVLDRHLDLNCNYLLEASAGTGKTYSIENIVVRLLIGRPPATLSEILIVTFTQAAARDLKLRIRSNLNRAIRALHHNGPEIPDYIQAVIEAGEGQSAKRKLEEALHGFDDAQIFTIHGFCSRMLTDYLFEGGISLQSIQEVGSIPFSTQMKIVNNFFRTEVKEPFFHPAQFDILGDIDKLKNKLISLLNKGMEIVPGVSFSESFSLFEKEMAFLKANFNINPGTILADFEEIKKYYKKVDGEEQKAERFACLFEKQSWNQNDFAILLRDGLVWNEKCQEENRRARVPAAPLKLNHPNLVKGLAPIISSAANPANILACLANSCRKYMQRYIEEEELMGFDSLLTAMEKGVGNIHFAQRIRSAYKAAIIDEFQDTDPIQWKIFKTLFLSDGQDRCKLYLVGDPKQSIYSFRQADIYTYLSAATALGENSVRSLKTNFRSQPKLIDGLNALFDPEFAPGLISLPKVKSWIDYEKVESGAKQSEINFKDGKGAVHFLTIDKEKYKDYQTELLFPYVANELVELSQRGIQLGQCAILVNNRFQADSLIEILKKWKIPYANSRDLPLATSPAVEIYIGLLQAIENPHDSTSLKKTLAGQIFNWNDEKILHLDKNTAIKEKIILKFFSYRRILQEKGIAPFFYEVMNSPFNDPSFTLSQEMLSKENGAEIYQDLVHLTELMAEEQCRLRTSSSELINFLNNLLSSQEEDNSIKKRSNPYLDAVQILTIHKSKGLEFDIVFPLGLTAKPPKPETLIPQESQEGLFSLHTVSQESEEYLSHCEEIDAEKMRQLYVALTRAKLRVYVPAALGTNPNLKWGMASHMELFAARMGKPRADYEELYGRIRNSSISDLENSLDKIKIPYTRLFHPPASINAYKKEVAVHLSSPRAIVMPEKRDFIYSYTTLSKEAQRKEIQLSKPPPHNFLNPCRTPHTLPSGSDIGILLHKILEHIPLRKFNKLDAISFIQPFVESTLYEGWEEAIGEIIYNALHTPLPFSGEKKSLGEVNLTGFYRESEFIYPWEEDFTIPETELQNGFLKGVIDLIFEYNGKYYLLDWKSNWLGPSSQAYSVENLHKAMEENHYFLQAKVYTEALRRYVKLFDQRPFEEAFGGVFYLFLRGLESIGSQETGIYFLRD